MPIQSTTPCNKGLKPTEANTFLESPAAIKNKVSVNPAFATAITYGLIKLTAGM